MAFVRVKMHLNYSPDDQLPIFRLEQNEFHTELLNYLSYEKVSLTYIQCLPNTLVRSPYYDNGTSNEQNAIMKILPHYFSFVTLLKIQL